MDKLINLHVGTILWNYANGNNGITNTVEYPNSVDDWLCKLYPQGLNYTGGADEITLITLFGFLPVLSEGSINTGSTLDGDGSGVTKGLMYLRIYLEQHPSVNPGDTAYSLIFEFLSKNTAATEEGSKNYISLDSNCFGYPVFPTTNFPTIVRGISNSCPVYDIYKKYMDNSLGILQSLTESYDVENSVGRSRWMDKSLLGLVYQTHNSDPAYSTLITQMSSGGYSQIKNKYKIEPTGSGLDIKSPLRQNYSILKMLENTIMQPVNYTAPMAPYFDQASGNITIKLKPKTDGNGVKKYSILSFRSGGFQNSNEMIPEVYPNYSNYGYWWDNSIGSTGRVTNQIMFSIATFYETFNTSQGFFIPYYSGGPIATQAGANTGSFNILNYCPTGIYFSNVANSYYADGEKYRFVLAPSQFGLGMGYDIYCADEAIKFEMLPDETKTLNFPIMGNVSGTWKRFKLIRAGETAKTTAQLGSFD